ncbi:hypothetical protein [Novipirellula aureliae]|uniref:hypothetical protein n=1 Tax=Novipirellula aureliae TaxID=2527966 RepID=UPI0018CD3626|nr:hypothetical protein [Novipirellula aureliae]
MAAKHLHVDVLWNQPVAAKLLANPNVVVRFLPATVVAAEASNEVVCCRSFSKENFAAATLVTRAAKCQLASQRTSHAVTPVAIRLADQKAVAF